MIFSPNVPTPNPIIKSTVSYKEISRYKIDTDYTEYTESNDGNATAHPQPGLVESSNKSRLTNYMQSGITSPKPTEGLGPRTPNVGSNFNDFGGSSAEIHEPISANINQNFSAGVQDPTPIQVAENSENSANISPPSPAGSSEGPEGFWEYPPGFGESILDSSPPDSTSPLDYLCECRHHRATLGAA